MQELEKILEEIIKKSFCVEIKKYESETVVLLDDVEEILEKHMNDGWIPVERRLPTEEEQKKDDGDFEITIWNEYKQGEPFVSKGYFNGREFELQDKDYSTFAEVIAWRHLSEPYCPERSNNHDGE